MPNLHKIELKNTIEITDAQSDFIMDNCPEHGQMGSGGAYYVNAEVLADMRKALDPADEDKAEHKALIRLIEPIIKAEGLYEFYLEA